MIANILVLECWTPDVIYSSQRHLHFQISLYMGRAVLQLYWKYSGKDCRVFIFCGQSL